MHDQQPTFYDGSSERAVPASRRIAVLGTRKMGAAIAARLSGAGFELVPWDRTRERAVALGIGPVADSPADAVARVDVVISSLTGPDPVTSTYAGAEGALAAARGKLFIEMSTQLRQASRERLTGQGPGRPRSELAAS